MIDLLTPELISFAKDLDGKTLLVILILWLAKEAYKKLKNKYKISKSIEAEIVSGLEIANLDKKDRKKS